MNICVIEKMSLIKKQINDLWVTWRLTIKRRSVIQLFSNHIILLTRVIFFCTTLLIVCWLNSRYKGRIFYFHKTVSTLLTTRKEKGSGFTQVLPQEDLNLVFLSSGQLLRTYHKEDSWERKTSSGAVTNMERWAHVVNPNTQAQPRGNHGNGAVAGRPTWWNLRKWHHDSQPWLAVASAWSF